MKRWLLAHLLRSGAILLALAACESIIPPEPMPDAGPTPGPTPGPPVGGGMPAELVGEWYSGSPSSIGLYDPVTGSWGNPSGSGISYTFREDGTYQEGYVGQVRNGSCYTGFFIFIEGVARVQAATLTKTWSRGVLRVEDTCSPSLNEERELSGEELAEHQGRYSWRIRADGANTQQHLDITLPDGSPYVTLRRDGPLGSSR
jgi:hypothetical protein